MSFTFRLCVSYGILFVGVQVVYFGMKFNGAASPRNPMWHFTKGVHSILTYGTIFALGAILLVTEVIPLIISLIPKGIFEKLKMLESLPLNVTHEEDLEQENRSQEKFEDPPQSQKTCEEARQSQVKAHEDKELRKKQVIESRRNRSAEEVARSALDDFL